jgi:hypothetical protein
MSQVTKPQVGKTANLSSAGRRSRASEAEAMPFRRQNYQLLVVGVVLLLIGYSLLLVPSHFVDAKVFSPALYIAPVVIMGGFVTLIYAILKR